MKQYNLLVLAVWAGILWSCYEDKGNYDYKPVRDVVVANVGQHYSVRAATGVLKIKPDITPKEGVECTWSCYVQSGEKKSVIDTLGRDTVFNYQVNLEPGTYTFVLNARHVESGIFTNYKFTVEVTTALSSGWWVLKDVEDGCDMDFFSSDGEKASNLLEMMNGRSLKGKGNMLFYNKRTYPVWDESIKNYATKEMMLLSTAEEIAMVSPADGKIAREMDDLFYFGVQPASFQFFSMSNSNFVINGGDIYHWSYVQYTSPIDGRFASPMAMSIFDGGKYQIGGIARKLSGTFLLFDKLSSSFFYMQGTAPGLCKGGGAMSPVKMDADVLFMQKYYASSDNTAYALMKKRRAEGEPYLLLELDMNMMNKNPLIAVSRPLGETYGLVKADIRAIHGSAPRIYFVQDGGIYSHNVDTQEEREETVNFNGEEIVYMRHILYPPTGENWLVVATYSGGEYKVWKCTVGAEGRLAQPNAPDMKGTGRVKDILFRTPEGYTFNN